MKTAAVSAPPTIWSRRPAIWFRLAYLAAVNSLFSAVYRVIRWTPGAGGAPRRTTARGWRGSRICTPTSVCAWARKRVPAYADFMAEHRHMLRVLRVESFRRRARTRTFAGTGSPSAAGTGATPSRERSSTNRPGRRASRTTGCGRRRSWTTYTRHRELGALSCPTERLFSMNAFSMGAWATGTNMGIALSKVSIVKSTGPDLEKIVDTIETFGREYDYLICAYPPFLKRVVDELGQNAGSTGQSPECTASSGAKG